MAPQIGDETRHAQTPEDIQSKQAIDEIADVVVNRGQGETAEDGAVRHQDGKLENEQRADDEGQQPP